MSREIEIEKTFLAAFLPKEIKGQTPDSVEDVYIPEGSDFSILRLRNRNDDFEITKKNPQNAGDFSEHIEDTIKLSLHEYDALKSSSSKRVAKNRYKVAIDGHEAEVDVFTGELSGLVLIDFEFNNRADHDNFSKPDCCLLDVTQELTIRGGQLAGKKYEDIEDWLRTKQYEKIDENFRN